MSDPKRLFESSESEVERLLLRAGRERAPRGAKRRALAAATGVIAATTLTAGKATGATIAGKAAAGAKAASLLSLKWIVVAGVASVGMVAGTVAVRAVRAERAEAEAQTMSAAPAKLRVSPAPSPAQAPSLPVAPVVGASVPVAVDPPAAIAPTPAPAIAARPIAPAARPTASAGSTSTAELVMLDQARTSIAQGDPAHGLSILDAYASRFAHPVMGPEASILRIEALVKTGDRATGAREGSAFLRTNPTSPYAPRIRSLLGASNP